MSQFSSSAELEEFNAPPQRGLNFGPYLRTARRKLLLLIATTGLGVTAAWLASQNDPAIYEGSFQLLVEPVTSEAKFAEPSALTRTGGGVPNRELFSLDYPTQLEILRSPDVLSAIADAVKAEYPQFGAGALRKGLIVERLGQGRSGSTKILEVRYQGLDPKLVELVLKETSEKYLRYSLEERKTRIQQGVKFIEEQLPELRERTNSLESEIQTLQERYELLDPASQGQALFDQLRQLEAERIATQQELRERQTLANLLEGQLAMTPDEALVASTLSENPGRVAILAQLQEIETQLALESARFTSRSPNIQALENRRRNLLSLLEEETDRLLGENLAADAENPQVFAFQNGLRLGLIQQLVETDNQIQVLEARDRAVAQTRSDLEVQAEQFPAITRRYNELQRQLGLTTRTLDQLLNQRETLRVESAQTDVPWELIAEPQVPKDPLPASSRKKMMAGTMGGFLLGLAIALWLEKRRDVFFAKEDIADVLQLPFLGDIPLRGAAQAASPLVPDGDPRFASAFDVLFASIRFLYAKPPVRSLAVCSADAGDGKSTIALYLAKTAAHMERRVLLVDANLRHPQLHTSLELRDTKGLSDLLTHQLPYESLLQQTSFNEHLFVLPGGSASADASKMLGSTRMQSLAKELEGMFDLVIYDTANLGDFIDASFLAVHTDGVLLAIAPGKTSRSRTVAAVEQCQAYRLPLLGVVVNHPEEPQSGLLADWFRLHTDEEDFSELDRAFPEKSAEDVADADCLDDGSQSTD
ncbi:MAG: polysaccharide biosynthesis tyrosine autokinase [Coleofasciculaceae cyanobacterium SM2_3_26]|nr:polysaccharide biosynthesis tyrosine autokinase [Coleofasciculaceae cyanobacterium SM2_3_26]